MPTDLVATLAEFVTDTSEEDITPGARAIIARAFPDVLGCMLAGAEHPVGKRIASTARELAPSDADGAYVFDGGPRLPRLEAALVNGTLADAIDFDDTSHPSFSHTSGHIVPVLLAVGERLGASGRDLVTAYAIAHEVEAAMGRATNMGHFNQGFHTTGTLGTFGATAAACRIGCLDVDATRNALAIAASNAAGLRAQIGTMTKPLHQGLAAMRGVLSGELAANGWTASECVMERPENGFAAAYARDRGLDVSSAVATLGRSWDIERPVGLQVKPFPSCGATHPAIEAAVSLHAELVGDVTQVRRIRVGTTRYKDKVLLYDDPADGNQARFSLPYTVAAALLRGWLGPDDFTEPAVQDPAVRRLMGVLDCSIDPAIEDSTEHAATLSLEMADGSQRQARVDVALGKNLRPMTDRQLTDKFILCAKGEHSRTVELWSTWRNVEEGSVSDLISAVERWRMASSPAVAR